MATGRHPKYSRIPAGFPDARLIKLETNYRSTRRIVDTADRLIRENSQRIERTLRTENDEGEMVSLRELSDERHEARFIVDEIRRLQQKNGLRRSGRGDVSHHGAIARDRGIVPDERHSVPHHRRTALLRAQGSQGRYCVPPIIHNPYDELSLNRIIDNMPIGRGIGPKAIDSMRDWSEQRNLSLVDGFAAAAGAPDGPVLRARPDRLLSGSDSRSLNSENSKKN
ncbi:MAG: 3'-5' exonuclease [Thermomicrobiales bacterium]